VPKSKGGGKVHRASAVAGVGEGSGGGEGGAAGSLHSGRGEDLRNLNVNYYWTRDHPLRRFAK